MSDLEQKQQLNAVSPLDGRYRSKVSELSDYYSERSLIQYRLRIEVEYLISLTKSKIGKLQNFHGHFLDSGKESETEMETKVYQVLRGFYLNMTIDDALEIKKLENVTNHDVKSVEYFFKRKFKDHFSSSLTKEQIDDYCEYIHFGLTSQDINNTAVPLLVKESFEKLYLPKLKQCVLKPLVESAERWIDIPLLARTHGQPATPSRLGKEFYVFVERLQKQIVKLERLEFSGKFGGATGGLNAHHVAFPTVDWIDFADSFLKDSLSLRRQQFTTQIEHYDDLATLFDHFRRINTILIDLCRDIWTYISLEYFKQKIIKDEVGSSAMPHKVNPIDFENAEGNFGIANAIFSHLSDKLPISRLQRDLTDSTVLRNIGVPLGHTLIGFLSLQKGLGKLILNVDRVNQDLQDNWMVVSEAIQTILRREGYPQPYEALKALTRTNEKVTLERMEAFIDSLNVDQNVKVELKKVTPFTFTGLVPDPSKIFQN